jgi:hypothetical protein
MLITFFVGIFLQLFQLIQNQHQILRFLTPMSKTFEKNIFWIILALFANYEVKRAKRLLKSKNIFYKCVLE